MKEFVALKKVWVLVIAVLASWALITIPSIAIKHDWSIAIGIVMLLVVAIPFYLKAQKTDKEVHKGTSYYRSPCIFWGAMVGFLLTILLYWGVVSQLWLT